ncbi:MAG: hypothetical protein LBQ66_08855 [Planctomycetaceae bacterium]|nr:hypothetical protein [Planctomycetaceae bacterium]
MLSRYYIPLGMYRSVENEPPTESVHSVGMNRSVGGAFLRNARLCGNIIFYRAMQTYGLQNKA